MANDKGKNTKEVFDKRYTYVYTNEEMLDILAAINKRPISKLDVTDLLLKGKVNHVK